MLLCTFHLHRKQAAALKRTDHHHFVWVGIWDLLSGLQHREERELSFDYCSQLLGQADGTKEHVSKVGCIDRQDVGEVGGVEGPLVPPRHLWHKRICADPHLNTANSPDVAL